MGLEYGGVGFDELDASIVFDQLEAAGHDAFEASDMIDQVIMAGGDLDDLLDIAEGGEDGDSVDERVGELEDRFELGEFDGADIAEYDEYLEAGY